MSTHGRCFNNTVASSLGCRPSGAWVFQLHRASGHGLLSGAWAHIAQCTNCCRSLATSVPIHTLNAAWLSAQDVPAVKQIVPAHMISSCKTA